ncbi:6-phospho-3-hexuloisomerase [Paenibacillus alkaliterrae]|uniref:6-phospho-3-hexuloisomerase n=1 Tax=Paenibacillus alkaliterrae TaxID=320909 RepID=UPI001F3784F6|nr:6-phospho-3-hexuloisomerase [Paenibacillus alkaliterrae]MCF2938118.1 6-phospho-3-hexuloisomerase [Paenibacillus alkaliterrae]
MTTTPYVAAILNELNRAEDQLADEQVEQLAASITAADRIFVAGAGRSGLMMRAFAMRLMHLGLDAYAVGDTVTRSFKKGDLFIIGSGSGETKSIVPMAEKARSLGGTVAALTLSPFSAIGRLADIAVRLPGAPKDHADNEEATIQPMGSLFEQMLLLVCDAIVLRLMEMQDLRGKTMYGNHANLE